MGGRHLDHEAAADALGQEGETMSTDNSLRGSFITTTSPLRGGMSDSERAELAAAEFRWRAQQDGQPPSDRPFTTGFIVPVSVP
jgi:hypothetical protein